MQASKSKKDIVNLNLSEAHKTQERKRKKIKMSKSVRKKRRYAAACFYSSVLLFVGRYASLKHYFSGRTNRALATLLLLEASDSLCEWTSELLHLRSRAFRRPLPNSISFILSISCETRYSSWTFSPNANVVERRASTKQSKSSRFKLHYSVFGTTSEEVKTESGVDSSSEHRSRARNKTNIPSADAHLQYVVLKAVAVVRAGPLDDTSFWSISRPSKAPAEAVRSKNVWRTTAAAFAICYHWVW